MHFIIIIGTLHYSTPSMKYAAGIIQEKFLLQVVPTQKKDFFHEIMAILLEILDKDTEYGSQISDAIDVALYVLKVNPSHWSTFAKILGFDRDLFDLHLKEILFDLFYTKNFSINSDPNKLK